MTERENDKPGFTPANLEKFLNVMESSCPGFCAQNPESIAILREEARLAEKGKDSADK